MYVETVASPMRAKALVFLTVLIAFATPHLLFGEPIVGRVVGVADGDTLTVLDALKHQHKIRLSGIDAPEGGQAFGNRSKEALSNCAFGKQATVDADKSDRYGRSIGKVVVNGVDCNLRQIELGLAWHFVKYAGERPPTESKAYAAAEVAARAAKRGLWIDAYAMPPWAWRDGGQQAHAAAKESSRQCDCSTAQVCTGKRGGSYCLTDTGAKRYLSKH
jgi:endonuclease YncB( thermonuclease family)